MEIKPRDYQEKQINDALEYFDRSKKQKPVVSVAPVAAGKSIIIGGVTNQLKDPTIVLQPSIELLNQNYNKLMSFGGEASIYSASAGIKEIGHTTYATLGSIKNVVQDFRKIGVKNVIIDEAHYKFSPKVGSMFRNFLEELKPKKVLGYTATPLYLKSYGNMADSWSQLDIMTTGRPKVFSDFLSVTPISLMVERKYWAKINYELYDFDESKLRLNSSGADYNEHSIRRAISENGVNNNIYLRIKSLLNQGEKHILVFMDSVDNANVLKERFPESEVVDGKTPKGRRKEIVQDFIDGKVKIVFNFGTLTTGFDHPHLKYVILGRPTKSISLFYQKCGRVTRNPLFPKQKEGYIIDFCNNVKRFGRLEDLNFEYINGYGWGLFSKNELLSNVRMDLEKKQTKESIKAEIEGNKDLTFTFGKHKGKKVSQVPMEYLLWAKSNLRFSTKYMKELEKQIQKRIELYVFNKKRN